MTISEQQKKDIEEEKSKSFSTKRTSVDSIEEKLRPNRLYSYHRVVWCKMQMNLRLNHFIWTSNLANLDEE